MFALSVVVLVPVPDSTAKATITVTAGKAKYDATKRAIVSGSCDWGFVVCCVVGEGLRGVSWLEARLRLMMSFGASESDRFHSCPPDQQVWKLRRFAGGAEHALRADVVLVSTTKEAKPWARPPISMAFQVGWFGGWVISYMHIVDVRNDCTS
jgi:AP-2 complex subunit mu-1